MHGEQHGGQAPHGAQGQQDELGLRMGLVLGDGVPLAPRRGQGWGERKPALDEVLGRRGKLALDGGRSERLRGSGMKCIRTGFYG